MFLREVMYVPVCLMRQYSPRERLIERQTRSLRELLDYCYRNIPFYQQDVYNPARLQRISDYAMLPILSKQHLRSHGLEHFIPPGLRVDKCIVHTTSGTTGQRVQVVHDHHTYDYNTAAGVRRFFATHRYWPQYRLAHIRPFTPPKRKFEYIGLFRRYVIPAQLPLHEIKQKLLDYQPQVIVSYPIYLREVLRSMTVQECKQLQKTLKLIFTESELLIDAHRHYLEQGFNAPIFDDYSAFEVLSISFECHQHRHHIVEDRVFLEVVDDEGQVLPDGEEGHIIVTSFTERAMPLIRYRLGDKGYIEPMACACGRTFKCLKLTTGRTEDYITLPDGAKLYCGPLLHFAAKFPRIDECFVRQDETGLVTLYVVPDTQDPGQIVHLEPHIRQTLFALAGQEFALRVVHADTVPLTQGGKAKFITSIYRREHENIQH